MSQPFDVAPESFAKRKEPLRLIGIAPVAVSPVVEAVIPYRWLASTSALRHLGSAVAVVGPMLARKR